MLVVLQEIFTLSIDFCRTFAMHMTCPSVRPSQADIDSKLITVGSCSFHRRAAKRSRFFECTFYTILHIECTFYRGTTLARASNETVVHKN